MPAPPVTIAVDLRALVPEATGIGVYTRELLAALAARAGVEGSRAPRYLGMAHRRSPGVAALAEHGIEIEIQPAPLGSVWQQWRLPWRLRRGDVDLLFSPIFTLPVASPVPGVVTVPDLTVFDFPSAHTWKVRWSVRAPLAATLRTAERVIAISHSTARDLERLFPGSHAKTVVIHPGVSARFQPGGDDEIAATREQLGAPDGYLLYVGTLEPRKNLGRLLDAWEGLRRADEATPPLFLVGGEGWHSTALRRRIEKLAPLGLRHLGRMEDDDLVRHYQAARAFAYPSLYEGFGLPVAEALACGIPVLTSNVSSLPEVANGAALTVDPESTEALAEGLRRLVSDRTLAAELTARGIERAAELSWEKTAEATETVLREAVR
ncbi:MAG TPA: glycosyltransferase family 1 protein [Thermoanaerobaculia bacterium]|nr:glycosyltransferase family 1 protein [Thermoanaerobaculia bacterium]